MKKTLSIHLGRQLFTIEEDAYDRLQQYLQRLERSLEGETGIAEIIEDIEMRFAELLQASLGEIRKVVMLADIKSAITSLGEPEVITEDNGQQQQDYRHTETTQRKRRLYRDPEEGMLGGVCSGLAAYLHIDPVIIRILFVVFTFAGFAIPLYLLLWVVVPGALTPSERLQMQGKAVTVDTLKEEFLKAADRLKGDTLRARDRFQSGSTRVMIRLRHLAQIVIKFIGVILIINGFIWLTFVTLTVTGLLDFLSSTSDSDYVSTFHFLRLVTPTEGTHLLMWTAILLAGICGPVMMLLIGTRLITTKFNRYFKVNMIIFTTLAGIGLVCGLISGLQTARDFAVNTEVEQQHLTSAEATLSLGEIQHYSSNRKIVSVDGADFINIKKGMITDHGILVTYRRSADSLFHIFQIFSAQGMDHNVALKRSGHILHNVQLNGDKLLVDPYYSFPAGDGLRNQEVKVIIEIPMGKTLMIDNTPVSYPEREHNGSLRANHPFEAWD